MKRPLLTALLACLFVQGFAQTPGSNQFTSLSSAADSAVVPPNQIKSQTTNSRKWLAGGLAANGIGGSLIFLTNSNNYEYGKDFKTINDGEVWQQMDKSEHFFLSYSSARLLSGLGNWAGFSPQNSVLLGSAGSLLFLTTKEFLDGHNVIPGTGWSWTDMGANSLGIVVFASQQLAWQEQKVHVKFSGLPKTYEPALNARADILFGSNIPERILKDHNAQTYWLSFNLNALGVNHKMPKWLNLAVGYAASNMFGSTENIGYYNGQITFDRTDLKRYRQWYISPDIDLTKIKTNSRVVKTILFTLNTLKFPLPTLEYSNETVKGHWLHF